MHLIVLNAQQAITVKVLEVLLQQANAKKVTIVQEVQALLLNILQIKATIP